MMYYIRAEADVSLSFSLSLDTRGHDIPRDGVTTTVHTRSYKNTTNQLMNTKHRGYWLRARITRRKTTRRGSTTTSNTPRISPSSRARGTYLTTRRPGTSWASPDPRSATSRSSRTRRCAPSSKQRRRDMTCEVQVVATVSFVAYLYKK